MISLYKLSPKKSIVFSFLQVDDLANVKFSTHYKWLNMGLSVPSFRKNVDNSAKKTQKIGGGAHEREKRNGKLFHSAIEEILQKGLTTNESYVIL